MIVRLKYLFLLLLFLPFCLQAEEEVFLPVPLYVDSIYSGEIPLRINGRILVQPHPLFEKIRSRLDEKMLESVLTRWNSDDWVPYESLGGSFVKVDFDEDLLILSVTIPPESRRPDSYSLVQSKKAPSGSIMGPSHLSGVLNLEAWSNLDYEESDLSYEFNPELAVNYYDYVLEIKGGIQSGDDLFFLDYLRFVKDIPFLMARAEGGDLTYDADGFLSSNMVGLSLYRMTSLDLNYQSLPELGKTIYFPEAVDVEIRINDRTVKTQFVPAGTWTFKNFPLSQGPNEVSILWEDSSGEHEESFFQIYDSGLLKRKELDWGVQLGTDSWITINPSLLLHLSQGLTDTLTVGASSYYELNEDSFSLEAPFLYATTYGTFSFVPDTYLTMGESYSLGMSLNHSYSEKRKEKRNLSFGSSLALSVTEGESSSQNYSFLAYYVHSPLKSLSYTPSVSWSYDTDDEHSLEMTVRVRTSGGDGSSISTELGMAYDEGEWAPQATITYSASFPDVQQNFYALGDLSGEKMTVSWSRYEDSNSRTDYTLGTSSTIPANNEDRFTLAMSGGYLHPFFVVDLSQGFNAYFEDEDYANYTTLSFGSAFVYADGVLGVCRPVRGSFIIVDSEIGPLTVNPTSRGSLLDVDGENPAILDTVTAYRYTTLRMMPESLPIGADIDDYTTSVFPTYRSGTLIRASEKVYMYVGGILEDGEGRPLGYLFGKITPNFDSVEDENRSWPREFFTDESGYFECYGLIPGEYYLTLEGKEINFKVDITVNNSGYCDLGVVKPER
jgi:outer membrane usher protein